MDLKKKTIQGMKWMTIAQFVKQACNFVILIILAHILSPNDFGLIGMATVFTGSAVIFSELGMGSALIQKIRIEESHISSIFWLNIAVGIIFTILFMLAAPLIAAFYGKPLLKPVISVIALNFFLAAFTIIQQALLQKEMNFMPLMVRDIVALLGGGIIGIFCACTGLGVWSLVFQLLGTTLINGFLLWTFSPWRPKFIFSFSHIKPIFSFSANLTGVRCITYISRNIDNLLIGKFLGSEALGFYSLGYRIMLLPIQNISWVINKVVFPAFSKIQEDLPKLRKMYKKMIEFISILAFPLMSIVFVLIPDIVGVFFGDKWTPIIPLVRIFCFCGMIQSLFSIAGSIYLSQGRADLQFRLSIISTTGMIICLLSAMRYGINTVALAYTLYYVAWSQISFFFISRILEIEYKYFLLLLSKSILICFIFILVLAGIKSFLPISGIPKIIIIGLLGLCLNFGLILLKKFFIIKEGGLQINV